MASLLTDDFEGHATGSGSLTPPWTIGPLSTSVRVAAGVGRSASQAAVNRNGAMQYDGLNPSGGIVPSFDVTGYCYRVAASETLAEFGTTPGLRRGLSIQITSASASFTIGFSNPSNTDDLSFFNTYDGTAITVPNVILTDTWQKFRLVGRLSTVASGVDVNADGCCKVYLDDVLVVDAAGLKAATVADWVNSSSPNTWTVLYFAWTGYLDDISANNDTVTCSSVTLSPVPGPTPQNPTAPCGAIPEATGGGIGKAGCTPAGTGWTSSYSGPYGTVPSHTDPTDGELLTGKDVVDFWIAIHHVDYPSGTVTVYRKALVELADLSTYYGGRKEGGLLTIGAVEHGLGNEQGGFEAASADFNLSDAIDRWFRTLADGQDMDGDEVEIYLASPAARATAAAPRVLMRGVIQGQQLSDRLVATLTVVDRLFSIFGPLGRSPEWPSRRFEEWFPDAPNDVKGMVIPIIAGEKSDIGAVDQITAAPASRGLCPGHFVGYYDPGIPETPVPLAPPTISTSGVTGAGGNTTYDFAVTGRNLAEDNIYDKTGETTAVLATVSGAPAFGALGASNYVYLTGTMPTGTLAIRVYVKVNGVYNHLDDADINLGAGTWFYHYGERNGVTDVDVTEPAQPPTADQTDPRPDWGLLVFALGPVFRYLSVYGSDLGNQLPDQPHNRILLNPTTRNDILVPGINWVAPYLSFTNAAGEVLWVSGILVRGPLLDDHLAGTVNITANILGVESVGDGTGLPIIDAHAIQQWWLENHLLRGWTSGAYATAGSYPQWTDGTPIVRSSRFATRQAYTASTLGGRGLTVGWYVDRAKALNDWFKEWNDSTETVLGFNGHGQITLGYQDATVSLSTLPRVSDVTDLFGATRLSKGQSRENVVVGSCDWDPDYQKYRAGPITLVNANGVTLYKGHRKPGDVVSSSILNNETQFTWVLQQRLNRLAFGVTTMEISGRVGLLDYDVDNPGYLSLTSIEGIGALGYVDQPLRIIRRRFDIGSHLATLTLVDDGLAVATGAGLQDEGTMAGNLGDETLGGGFLLS